MRNDLQHLGQLSTFHYVLAALLGVLFCIPIIHLTIGIMMIASPDTFFKGMNPPPPPFLGWLFVGIASVAMVSGWTLAILMALAGRFLARRTHYRFCFAVAILSCLYTPLGTVLGVFTIIVLIRPSVKALFDPESVADVEPA